MEERGENEEKRRRKRSRILGRSRLGGERRIKLLRRDSTTSAKLSALPQEYSRSRPCSSHWQIATAGQSVEPLRTRSPSTNMTSLLRELRYPVPRDNGMANYLEVGNETGLRGAKSPPPAQRAPLVDNSMGNLQNTVFPVRQPSELNTSI